MRFGQRPSNIADIIKLEKTPLSERIPFKTTYDVLKHAATTWPEKPAIHFLQNADGVETPVTLTYQQLLDQVNQAANLFLSQQNTNGPVVSYLLPNLPQTQVVLWGAQAVGVVNPLRPDLSPEQIVLLMQKANSKTLVTVGEFIPGPMWQNVLAARKLYPALKTIYVIGGQENTDAGIYDFMRVLNQQSAEFAQPDISSNAVCAYFHTSATTTRDPKLVRLTHQGQLYSAWAIGTCLGYQHDDVIGVGLPFFHVGAPMVGGLVPFVCGATTVLMSPMGWMNPAVIHNFWKIVLRYQITITAALNFMYSQLLMSAPAVTEKQSLRLAIAGTPVSAEEAGRYQSRGIYVVDIYGSSETIMASFNPVEEARAGSMGLRFPYEAMKVMRANNTECDTFEVGELWIKGPNITAGYQGDAQNAFDESGWFKTGDLIRQDIREYGWFFDRTVDVIRSTHGLISSMKLEHQFEAHPKVARAAVIAQSDEVRNEVPVLFVTAKPQCELTIAELQQWAKNHVDPQEAPVHYFIEAEFTLNGIAKILKPVLREKLRATREQNRQERTPIYAP